jgi:hypothetical protein
MGDSGLEAGKVKQQPFSGFRMFVKTIHCAARLHHLCPGGNETMECVCECHGRDDAKSR